MNSKHFGGLIEGLTWIDVGAVERRFLHPLVGRTRRLRPGDVDHSGAVGSDQLLLVLLAHRAGRRRARHGPL